LSSDSLIISIVTVCRNSAAVIERTIKSVIEQQYDGIEYIIIDGASVDATVEIARRYEEGVSRIVSEPDSGVYDAMNKGVKNAAGDYILFLNAGDFLIHPAAIQNVVRQIENDKLTGTDVIAARLLVYNPKDGGCRIWRPAKTTRLALYHGSLPHPSTFHKRGAFEKNGLFDESYRIAGDYEWFVRGFVKNGLTFGAVAALTSVFFSDGLSSNAAGAREQDEEIRRLRGRYFSPGERFWLDIGRFLKKNKII